MTSLDRHGGIHAMLIEKIDMVGLESAQRSFDRLANVCRPAVYPSDAVRAELEAEFGGNDHAITRDLELFERASQQLLVFVRSVRLGRVEERHAELNGATDGGDRLAFVALVGSPVSLTHSHQTEPEGGDFETLITERARCQHF
ncbi:MAG TPA: hypothetical protein VGL17_13335 [Gemmatimonadaceae bacterium]